MPWHPLFISRKRVYFPWDHINWTKEELSNGGEDYNPLGLAATSFHKTKRKIYETIKTRLSD